MYEHGKKAEPSAKTETKAPSKAAASPNPTRQPAWTNALGSQPVPALQPKLTVNQPGDEYEQEADRVAAQVMRMASPAVTQVQRCACGGIAGPDGECASCKAKRLGLQRQTAKPEEEGEKPALQAKRANDHVMRAASSAAPPPSHSPAPVPEEEEDEKPALQAKQANDHVMRAASSVAPPPSHSPVPEEEEEKPALQAKRANEQVMRAASSAAPPSHSPVPEEEEEEKPALQAKLANDHVMRAASSAAPPSHSPVPEEEEEKPALQAKLTINQPGDKYEQEADHVAAQVMRAASSATPPPSHAPVPEEEEEEKPALQAKRVNDQVMRAASSTKSPAHSPAPEEEEEEKPALQAKATSPVLQRKPSGNASPAEAPPSVHETLRSSGQPLEDSTRTRMERSFGQDFSGVQVHTGDRASRSSADIGALAYTVGEHVVFGAGQYTPGTRQGDTLIAHELTHTVQQRGGSFSDGPFNNLSSAQRLPDVTYLQMANIPGWVIDMMPGALEPLARDIDKAGGIFAYIEKILGNVVNRIFGGLKHGANTVADLIDNFTKLYVSVGKIGAAIASGNRERFAQAVTDLASALQSIIGHGWDALESLLGPVGNFLDGVVQTLDQPPEQGIKNFAGDIWSSVINIGRTIWNLVHDSGIPGVGLAWDSIRSWLGITGPDTYDSVVHWIEGKASEVWGAIKGRLSGVLSTVRDTATTIRKVISVENIRSMREEVDEWIIHVRDTVIALNGDDGNGVASKQSILRNVLIPAIKSGAASVRKLIIEAGGWVAGLIAGLATKIKNFITNAGANPFLSVVPELFDWVTKAVDDLSSWAQKTVIGLFNAAGDGIVRLSEFVEPVLDTLINLASTTVDLVANLPNLLTAAWNAIPAWIREPIKKFVLQQVLGRIPIFKQLMDDPSIWERAKAVAMRILQQIFVDGDLMGAAWTFFQSLLDLLHFPSKLVVQIVEKATKVFKQIFNDPLSFFKNLLSAVKKGFSNFFDHIGKHLLNGLSRWLFGQAAKAGIKPPADLSLGSILQFVLDLLGINMEMIWERLALKIGAERVAQIRKAIDILTGAWEWISLAVTKGPGALWEKLQEKISELWNKVIDGAVSWITQTLIEKAITKVLSMLDPTGIMAVVNSAIAIYNAIESFIEYVTEMLEIVNKVLDGIQEIANGVLDTAATFLENALADGLPVAIGFLANQVGLGKIGEKLGEIIQTVREYVIKGIDWLIDKALQGVQGALALGQKAVGAAAEWWNRKFGFKAQDGSSHAIFFNSTGGKFNVMLASDPIAADVFLDAREKAISAMTDPQQKQAMQQHVTLARSILGQINNATSQQSTGAGASSSSSSSGSSQAGKQNQLDPLLQQLSQHLAALVVSDSGSPVPRMVFTPGFSSNRASSPVTVKYLFNDNTNHTAGTAPAANSLRRPTEILRALNTNTKWVRFHILNDNLGGQGVDSNLIPIPGNINNPDYLNTFEKPLKDKFAAKKVIWMEANFAYHADNIFIQSFTASGGEMKYENNKWDKDPAPANSVPTFTRTINHPTTASSGIYINQIFEQYHMYNNMEPLRQAMRGTDLGQGFMESVFEHAVQQGITKFNGIDDLLNIIDTIAPEKSVERRKAQAHNALFEFGSPPTTPWED